ncbi:hypothetical protein RQ479_21210 [Mesorhizobium sp. ISC25]|uniref:hypothetical protein n=1 Tax=Mesorhizobium sp. ISC25 TaxID=3077335 RepID=UPI0035DCF858
MHFRPFARRLYSLKAAAKSRRTTSELTIWFFLFLLVGMLIGAANAAELAKGHGKGCLINLSGEIVPGDFKALQALATSSGLTAPGNSGEESNSTDAAICLDSPGGNYVEGRLIAGFVHDYGITTRIPAGASCYSSCAFLFMAGRAHGAETDGPSRYLNVSGHLGFHAPYFTLAEGDKFSGKDVSEMLTLSEKVIAEFIKFGSFSSEFDAKPMFSLSLLAETLNSGPKEIAEVNTVEKAVRWGIFLEGTKPGAIIGHKAAVQTCLNFQAWMLDKSTDQSGIGYYETQPLETAKAELWGETRTFAKIDTGGMEAKYCYVEVSQQPTAGMAVCSRDEYNGVSFGDCLNDMAIWVPWYQSLPPATPITALGDQ